MASNFSDSCEMITCCKWGRIDGSISEEGQGLGHGEPTDLGEEISMVSMANGRPLKDLNCWVSETCSTEKSSWQRCKK